MTRLHILVFLLLSCAACQRAERPAAPTADEAARLDDTSRELDGLAASDAPANASDPSGADAAGAVTSAPPAARTQ